MRTDVGSALYSWHGDDSGLTFPLERAPEKEMATYSSTILTWEIP